MKGEKGREGESVFIVNVYLWWNALHVSNAQYYNIWIFFHMLFSYLITETLILECLYWDRQFWYGWIKKIFGIINKQRGGTGCKNKYLGEFVKNSKINKRLETFIWHSRVNENLTNCIWMHVFACFQ